MVAALIAVAAACGGKTPVTPVVVPPADARAEAGAANWAITPPPSGLPPMAPMPPPGVNGSKKAKVKEDSALTACGDKTPSHAKDPADLVKKIGEACASASKMKPVGTLLKGTQADKDPHQENKFHAEANHCYRVYFATDDNVKDVVITLKDGNGDVIVESPGPSAPQYGSACFTQPDDAVLMLAIGSGNGNWAAQLWGD